jgi:hypothetical protein
VILGPILARAADIRIERWSASRVDPTMIKAWVVRLELARDDGSSLGDDVIRELARPLAGTQPSVSSGEGGTVLAQITVDATNDQEARASAERLLRDRAQEVWGDLGLPPFTITVLELREAADPRP